MTRKSKARYGLNRTYKLNPAVKALRNALFAGITMAAIAPGAQATCVEVANTVTCSGIFGGTLTSGGDLLVSLPFDPATIILDDTTVITALGGGVNAVNSNDLTIISDAIIDAYGPGYVAGIYALSQFGDTSVTNNGTITAYSYGGGAAGIVAVSNYNDVSVTNNGSIEADSDRQYLRNTRHITLWRFQRRQ